LNRMILYFFITFLSAVVFLSIPKIPLDIRAAVTGNPLACNVLPIYRSMRKLPDIVFFPYLFIKNKLPRYYLYIAYDDIVYLNANLPISSPFTSILLDKNRVSVKALFESGEFSGKVDVRYKGLNPDHWNSLKKSYKISFKDGQIFEQASTLNFTLPFDKGYYAELLNAYRAEKFGLLTQNMRLGNLTINGQNNGVYLISNHWSPELLEANRIPDNAVIFGLNDGSAEVLGENDQIDYAAEFNLFSLDGIRGWKSYTHEKENYEELQALLSIITYAPDDTFEKAIPLLLDLNKFYAWDILTILAGDVQQDFENLGMVFNTATGKFEFLPVDVMINPSSGQYFEDSIISKRVFAIDEFREKRNNFLKEYIGDNSNLDNDLQFYDELYKSSKYDFFQDYAKKHNNFVFLRWVKDIRQYFVDNFNDAWFVLKNEYAPFDKDEKKDDFVFAGSFGRFGETYINMDEFIARNPQFIKRGTNTVGLLGRKYVFSKTVVIPTGLQVEIDAGAVLEMGPNVSFLSYSPIHAEGTENLHIIIRPIDSNKPWGTFAVLNTEQKKSIIKYVEFYSGSGDIINGVKFSGMAAFHNADVDVSNSKFSNAFDDDGLNVKYGNFVIEDSLFENNFSDGIDIDFGPKNAIIRNNTFVNNGYGGGGDSVDLSWSDIIVEGNEINGCTDKGISVGEKSNPIIKNNTIQHCDIGIVVKDLSVAQIDNNLIEDVRVGVAAYQKKAVFGGGKARVSNLTFNNATIDFEQDDLSEIIIAD